MGGMTFSPQLQGLPSNADLVFVLGGGNDINYIGGLMADSTSSFSESGLAGRYGDVLDALHAAAPAAKVVVVEYLTMLGADANETNVPFNQSRIAYHQGVAAALQRASAAAADNSSRADWCARIPVAAESWGHGLGSEVPWVDGKNAVVPFHPNLAGMRAVAQMLYDRFGNVTRIGAKL